MYQLQLHHLKWFIFHCRMPNKTKISQRCVCKKIKSLLTVFNLLKPINLHNINEIIKATNEFVILHSIDRSIIALQVGSLYICINKWDQANEKIAKYQAVAIKCGLLCCVCVCKCVCVSRSFFLMWALVVCRAGEAAAFQARLPPIRAQRWRYSMRLALRITDRLPCC